jgi:hypothetical protein
VQDHFTYDAISPLVTAQQTQGRTLHLTFQCPQTGTLVQARGMIQPDNSITGNVARSASRSVMWSLRSTISRTISSALGYGIAGRAASQAASAAMSGMTSGSSNIVLPGQKQTAVVEAFKSVANKFRWDTPSSRWVSVTAESTLSPFDEQVQNHPIAQPYDRGVMMRMLAEIASADGTLSREERDYLFDFYSADLEPIDEVLKKPKLSPVELSETEPEPSRETMLLLAWSLALTDESLDAAEDARLAEFGQGLEIGARRATELKHIAQTYLVENLVSMAYSIGQDSAGVRKSALELAARIGMDSAEAERVEIRYRKRHGS